MLCYQGRHLQGAEGPSSPKKKKKERKKKKKKEEREKKEKKERKKGTMDNVKLLHNYEVLFFQFFNIPVALIFFSICPPRKSLSDAPVCYLLTNQSTTSFITKLSFQYPVSIEPPFICSTLY